MNGEELVLGCRRLCHPGPPALRGYPGVVGVRCVGGIAVGRWWRDVPQVGLRGGAEVGEEVDPCVASCAARGDPQFGVIEGAIGGERRSAGALGSPGCPSEGLTAAERRDDGIRGGVQVGR